MGGKISCEKKKIAMEVHGGALVAERMWMIPLENKFAKLFQSFDLEITQWAE